MSLEVVVRHRLGVFTLDIAFTAPPGVTALFGPSGAGKTSIVNAIAGLTRPDYGRIVADGTVLLDTEAGVFVPRHKRRVGYVFQEGRLFPHLSVRQNLVFGRWFAPRGVASADFGRIVEMLGIGHLLDRRPAGLSGGEKQRVAIGRALLAGPRLLLMDEPLASLDTSRKDEILPYLARLRDDVRAPIIYVSHAVPEVTRLATTVVAIADGRVVLSGPAPQVLSNPDLFRGLEREEAGVVLGARLVAQIPEDGLSELAIRGGRLLVPQIDAGPGAQLRVRIRARDVVLATRRPEAISALNVLDATVAAIGRRDGTTVEVVLAIGEDRLIARITRRSLAGLGLVPGVPCFALVKSISVGRRDVGSFEEHDG